MTSLPGALATVCVVVLVAGCSNGHVGFDVNDCLNDATGKTRLVQRQGACLVRNQQTHTCITYHRYEVRQSKWIVRCSREEWRDGATGVE